MRSAALLALTAVIASAPRAFAQDGDGVYGRFDSSTSVVIAGGGAYDFTNARVGAMVDARVRVAESFGLVATLHTEHPGRARVFTGLELRPLFPALFLQQLSTGRAFVDLLIQSFAVELGVDLTVDRPVPVSFTWGLAIEIPILSPERFAHGLGIRLGARHSRTFRDGRPNPGLAADDTAWTGYAMLSIGFDAGQAVANWEPPRHRDD